MSNDLTIGIYEQALENIKFALNNRRSDAEALHTIGNEVSWALSQGKCTCRVVQKGCPKHDKASEYPADV